MKPLFLALLGLWAAGLPRAEETETHQRIGVEKRQDHRWEGGWALSLVPWPSGAWDLSLSSSVSYEFARTASVRVGLPYLWTSGPGETVSRSRWGDLRVGFGLRSADGEPRGRLEASLEGPVEPSPGFRPWRLGAGAGISLVRDPVVLGGQIQGVVPLLSGTAPEGCPLGTGGVVLSFQELLNDSLAWTLSAGPRVALVDGRTLWSAALSLGVGWFEGGRSLSVDLGSGTGEAWSLAVSGSESW